MFDKVFAQIEVGQASEMNEGVVADCVYLVRLQVQVLEMFEVGKRVLADVFDAVVLETQVYEGVGQEWLVLKQK